jgi:hypothetical protein
MTDLKNDLEQILISEGTKAMMLKLAEESYRQGVNDTLQSAKEAAEKAFVLGIEKALAAEQEACVKACKEKVGPLGKDNVGEFWVDKCVDAIRARGGSK